MNFINQYSWKCFLGPQAKNIKENNDFHLWETSKLQLVKGRKLINSDLDYLKSMMPFNFYYFMPEDLEILKSDSTIKIIKHSVADVSLTLPEALMYKGRKFHGIRGAINKNIKKNFELLDHVKKIEDVKEMISRWDEQSGEKYFRSHAGKNTFFYKNNFHQGCINLFVYDQEQLIGMATLSPPDENGVSSYIIGKALCLMYPGLSEFCDIKVYEKALQLGVKKIQAGGGGKLTVEYKLGFNSAIVNPCFDGTAMLKEGK